MKNAAIDRRGIFFWLRERKPGLLRLSFEAVLFKRFCQLFMIWSNKDRKTSVAVLLHNTPSIHTKLHG
jgi:hypothetical protein